LLKARRGLSGIICLLLLVATSSLYVVSTNAATSSVPYPPCNLVPSWYLRASLPKIWFWTAGPQSVSATSVNLATGYYPLEGWSSKTAGEQKLWLSGTALYLFIDGRFMPLKFDICYDKTGQWYEKVADTVYKVFYVPIGINQYKGPHDFVVVFFWEGILDLTYPPYIGIANPNEFTVTFT
jgi:hypothetical protein